MHGMNARFISSKFAEYMDEFLAEYLRVNEEACKKRFSEFVKKP